MVLYQTMSRYFYISHADNELLQILAEGRPAARPRRSRWRSSRVSRSCAKRLREDRTAIFWLRAGAASGMVALGAQNMVEMTLRVPANAVLLAVAAAIAMHDGDS